MSFPVLLVRWLQAFNKRIYTESMVVPSGRINDALLPRLVAF